jgi:hypothetical protein
MYLVSLHGHATSARPGSSGAPTECRHLTKVSPRSSNRGRTAAPIRVMIFIETTTYSESVISTPSIGGSASSGPMQNGMTYIVRPRIDPRYSSVIVDFISAGATQLFVGPAPDSSLEQMNVRSSTRATSSGSDAAQKEFGFFSRRVKVPASTSAVVVRSHSSSEPSTQTTRSGVVSSATSRTQASSGAFSVGAWSRPGTVAVVMGGLPRRFLWECCCPPAPRRGSGGLAVEDGIRRYRRRRGSPHRWSCRFTHKTDSAHRFSGGQRLGIARVGYLDGGPGPRPG